MALATVVPPLLEAASPDSLDRQTEALQEEILSLQVRLVGVARKMRSYEVALSQAEDRLAELEAQEVVQREALAANRERHRLTLAALQRIALQPPATLIARADDPIDSLRGTLLLRAALPEIDARARSMREEIEALGSLRRSIAEARLQSSQSASALKAEQDQIAALISVMKQRRAINAEQRRAMAERAQQLARHAKTLRELLAKVEVIQPEPPRQTESSPSEAEAEPLAPPPVQDEPEQVASLALVRPDTVRHLAEGRDRLVLPTHGRIVTRFGEALPAGSEPGGRSRGIMIRARAGSQVIAPFDGKVVYAGPFRSYGRILIIDHGGEYHSLLAGLGRIDAVVGQWVLAGEPLAVLSGTTDQNPDLYLELRYTGQPVNPMPWLSSFSGNEKG